jgi:hypothetical protein
MRVHRSRQRLGTSCLLATVALASGALGDATITQSSSQAADRSSKFYLQLNDPYLDANQPYQTEVKEINHLGRAKDLKGLVRLADDIEQTWGRQADTRGYFALMDVLTGVLVSYNFGPRKFLEQDEFTQKYVMAELAHNNVPLDITARLLPRLIPEEQITLYRRPFNTSNWARLRSARAPLWLQTRQRLKQCVIPGYDFTSPVYINYPFDPEALKDPKQAAAHNKMIEDNNRKVQGRNDQSLVRLLDQSTSPAAEDEVISYYSHPPYDPQELKRLLDTYAVDAATRQRILDQVAKNIAAASQK